MLENTTGGAASCVAAASISRIAASILAGVSRKGSTIRSQQLSSNWVISVRTRCSSVMPVRSEMINSVRAGVCHAFLEACREPRRAY